MSRGKAAIKCEEYQLQLAPIHSTNLMSIVGRELELVVLKKKLTNTRCNVRFLIKINHITSGLINGLSKSATFICAYHFSLVWTNVRYDPIKESYYWQHPTREPDKKRVVKYSSFLYKHPRYVIDPL